MKREILVIACLVVVGGLGAWATGSFDSKQADAGTTKTTPASETSMNTTPESGGGCCPFSGKDGMTGSRLSMDGSGPCPALTGKSGCGSCEDKASCEKDSCGGKPSCDDCPEKGGCEKPEDDCSGECEGGGS